MHVRTAQPLIHTFLIALSIYLLLAYCSDDELGPRQPKRSKITTDCSTGEDTEEMYINDRVITTQFLKYFDESAMEENPTSPPLPETEDTMVERAEPLVNNNIVEELKDPIMAKVVETTKCKWFGKLPIAY